MTQAKRTDANQAAIVQTLRQVGATVQDLSKVGKGVPDLLVGYRGTNFVLEVKTSTGRVRPGQTEWHAAWRGQRAIVRTADEALKAIGAIT